MKNKSFIFLYLSLGLISFAVVIQSSGFTTFTANLEEFSITRTCNTGVSNLYLKENSNYDLFGSGNYTYIWGRNISVNNFNMSLTALNIKITDLRDSPYTLVVADNTTNPQFAVPETVFDTPRARMAQYFKLDNFSLIQKVWVYLNYSIGGLFPTGNFQINFYNASNLEGGAINENPHILSRGSETFEGWREITINEYFEAGEYYAVFSSWLSGGLLPSMNNNSWNICNYSSSLENKGASLFENSSGWFPIPDDSTADFLMMLNVTHYCSPYEVNLSAFINDEPVQLHHNRDYTVRSVKWGKSVWISELLYYLPAPPTQDYNISITLNRTVHMRSIITKGRYIYDEPTTGTFFANLSSVKWEVNYRKVNSSSSLLVFFQFPTDWKISKFYNVFGVEIIEYGILYSYIYGENKNGIWIEEGGDGTQTFDYTATFSSPNYITNMELLKKPLFAGEFSAAREVYFGEPFKIQATIKNGEGELITTGNCSFYLFNSNGIQIYSCNKTNTNGVVTSDEIATQGWALGTYSMVIFWTNGEEYGMNILYISVSLSPLLYVIIIAVIVASVTIFALTYGRRKLAERNWIKSLHHLLVLSKKDGRPMYNYSFGVAIKDASLVSGMISAMTSFVRETTGSKKQLRVIDQEDKKIILSHGTMASVTILCEKDLPIIHKRAQAFLQSFEEQYGPKLRKWTGNVEIFKGASKLVEDFFPISMEQKLINKCGNQLQELKTKIETAEDEATITEILKTTTNLTELYQDLILKNFHKLINEIIKIAHEKLAELQ